MREIIIYLLKSGLWIGLFGLIYWLFLRKETFYKFNRFFLLFGLFASFLLPFCVYKYTIRLDIPPFSTIPAESVAVIPESSVPVIFPWMILLTLHVAGALFLLFRHLNGALKLKRLIVRNGFQREKGTKIIHVQGVNVTFSIFNYIFTDSFSNISEIERKMIYEHERAHIDQCHWVDLIIVHAVCVFQWFNPVVWIYLNSIKQNHEFLADQEVLRKGNSPAVYRAALINYTLKTPVFAFANAFAQHNKFKRIDMMKKNASNPVKKGIVLLLAPALAAFLWFFAEPEYVFAGTEKDHVVNFKITVVDYSEMGDSLESGTQVSDPLILVDGEEFMPEIKSIEADDIESVSVIKDTSALSPYGTRGANGVLLITTKKRAKSLPPTNSTVGTLLKINDIPLDSVQLDTEVAVREKLEIKSKNDFGEVLVILNGVEYDGKDLWKINVDSIESISILKEDAVTVKYGEKAKNGVLIITTKVTPHDK
ncbi:MAG: TonB-dependent receptor plug domain-containing protein [Dysgonamonadaceae bacterium]|jgi:TonB-dependent SusC/RagA subfamily outer membrane receptor|nr:TonB-dependent receptor plug domain-containing protein [Dysgonamonadaceae bacterium]